MNWESEEDMKRDVEENRELYEALVDDENKSLDYLSLEEMEELLNEEE